jgi:hypothetical protein
MFFIWNKRLGHFLPKTLKTINGISGASVRLCRSIDQRPLVASQRLAKDNTILIRNRSKRQIGSVLSIFAQNTCCQPLLLLTTIFASFACDQRTLACASAQADACARNTVLGKFCPKRQT